MSDCDKWDEWKKEAEENDEELRILFNVVLDKLGKWELKACDKCLQMTNHDKDGCLKCKDTVREK